MKLQWQELKKAKLNDGLGIKEFYLLAIQKNEEKQFSLYTGNVNVLMAYSKMIGKK